MRSLGSDVLMTPSHAQTLELSQSPLAPSLARQFVRVTCQGCDPDVMDSAVLLTSELVTNAISHAVPTGLVGAPISVIMEVTTDKVRIEVYDGDASTFPSRADRPPSLRSSGWGLVLVDRMSTEWGSTVLADGRGKVVWFQLALSG